METPALNGYAVPTSRAITVWMSNDIIDYVTRVAEELTTPDDPVTRNRAFTIIIERHRELAAARAKTKERSQNSTRGIALHRP